MPNIFELQTDDSPMLESTTELSIATVKHLPGKTPEDMSPCGLSYAELSWWSLIAVTNEDGGVGITSTIVSIVNTCQDPECTQNHSTLESEDLCQRYGQDLTLARPDIQIIGITATQLDKDFFIRPYVENKTEFGTMEELMARREAEAEAATAVKH